MWVRMIALLAALGVGLVASAVVFAQSNPPTAKSPTTQSGAAPTSDAAKPATQLSRVAGKVTSVSPTSLTLETRAKPPKQYTFDLTGAAIKVGGKDAAAADLKEGDEIRVSYAQSEGKLVAKTVVARIVKPAK